jgi:hypothetical protein
LSTRFYQGDCQIRFCDWLSLFEIPADKRKEKTMRNGTRVSGAALIALGGILLLSSCVQVTLPGAAQPTLSQQVVAEYKTSLNASAGRGLSKSFTSTLSAAQVDSLTSAAQAAIDAAGLHDSKALDKIVKAFVQGVATQVATASTAANPVDLSASLVVASRSAVVSMGKPGREANVTAGLTTATAIADVTAKMVDIVNTTITDTSVRAAAKAGIVTEAIAALDQASTITAASTTTAVTAIVKQVATQEAGDDVSFKAVMAAATVGASTLTKVSTATIAPQMASAAVEAIKAAAADTTKVMTSSQTDALISAVASQISTGDATVDATISSAITTKLADTTAGAAALTTTVNVQAVVTETSPAVTATARVGDSGVPAASVSIASLGRVWLLATPSSGASVTAWTRTSIGPEPSKDSVSGNWYIDPLSSGVFTYKVLVTNTAGVKTASATVSVTSTIGAISLPPAPSAPTGLAVVAGNTQTTITWTAVSGATSYRLYYSTASGVTTTSGTRLTISSGTSFTQSGLTNGTTYYYILTAVNAGGESTASAEASAKPQFPVLLPTVANLTGSWKGRGMGYSTTNGGATMYDYTSTLTISFAADGTWTEFHDDVGTPAGGGPTVTSYKEDRGTYTISGNEVTLNTTDYRSLTSATDTTSAWSPVPVSSPITTIYPMMIFNGKLYGAVPGSLYIAQASTSGLIGTWAVTWSQPGVYIKIERTFNADGSYVFATYASPTNAFSAPYASTTGTYAASVGIMTETTGGSTSPATYYAILAGSYLSIGSDTTAGAFTKQ